jgi:hypothetical protein
MQRITIGLISATEHLLPTCPGAAITWMNSPATLDAGSIVAQLVRRVKIASARNEAGDRVYTLQR